MQLVDGISLAEVIERLRQCRDSENDTVRPCGRLAADDVHPAFLKLCQRCRCRRADPASGALRGAAGLEAYSGDGWNMAASRDYHVAVAEMIRDAAKALDHAHEHGILHLDVKPSNLLMDVEGKIWVTDFGASRSGSSSGSSGGGGRLGTLRYMSPEQLLGKDEQLDRRSDVYSLGVTLYELLTLERPPTGEARSALATYVARQGIKAPRDVNPAVPRELSAVAHKAMAETPGQRYATAAAMASDLQRFLDNKPAPARPSGPLRRAVNWSVCRQRVVWMVTLFLLIALSLLPVTDLDPNLMRQQIGADYFRAGAFRKSADHYQAALNTLRSEAGPTAPETLAVTIKLGETLRELGKYEEAERLLRDGLETSRRTLGAEHTTVRDALFQLHKLAQGQDKDDAVKAGWVAQMRQHIASRQRMFGSDDVETLEAVEQLAELLGDSGSHQEATPLLQQLVADRRRVLGPTHRATLEAEGNLALSWLYEGKAAEAEVALRANLEARRSQLGPRHESTLEAMNNLAGALIHAGNLEEAESVLRQACDGCRTTMGADHPRTALVRANFGWVLMLRNKLEGAEQLFRDLWETACRTRNKGHCDAVQMGYLLNRLIRQMGRYDEAEKVGRQNLAAARQSLSPDHTIRGEAMIQLALTLRALHRNDEAEKVESDDLTALFEKTESVADHEALARINFDHHDLAAADEWGRRVLDTMRRAPAQHPPISRAEMLDLLARVLVATDRTEEAETLLRECLAIRTAALSPDSWLVAETKSLLGDCLARRGLRAEAEPLLIDLRDE